MSAADALLEAGAFGMDDAAAGRHQVHGARPDDRLAAEAVAVHDRPLEEIGEGGKADVRMRRHVEPVADGEIGRPHLVPEDEGADHAPAHSRQGTAHGKAADVRHPRHDHEIHRIAGRRIAGHGVLATKPAHCPLLS